MEQALTPHACGLFSLDTGGVFLYVSSLIRHSPSLVSAVNPLLRIFSFWQNKILMDFISSTASA
jgi:hypothetical protein